MTTPTKTKITIVSIVTTIGLILGLWPQLVGVLNWLAPAFQREAVLHVALGWLAAAFTLPLPWVLPASLAPFWTKTFSAALAAAVASITVIVLSWPPTRTNVIYALFMAGLGSVTINAALVALYVHLKPDAQPDSLKP